MCRRPRPERVSCVFRILLLSSVIVALCFSMTAVTGAAQADSVGSDARSQMGVGDGSGDGGVQIFDDEEPTGNVTGTVSTPDGYRISDADVRLVNATSDTVERTTVSDTDGGYSFSSVEAGTYRVEAEFDESEGSSANVTVEEGTTRNRDVELRLRGAYFSVSVEDTNSPVTEGEEIRMDITVTNAGEESGSQAVVVEVPGLGSDAEPVSLDGGSSTTVSLRLPTELGDVGNYTAEVSTNDDTEEVEVVVEGRQLGIDVSILGTNSPVTEGEALTVEASVSNPSEMSGSGTVTAEITGADIGSDRQRFSLLGGGEETKNFRIPTEKGDAGEYTVTVSVGEHYTDSTNVTVEEVDGANETEGDGARAPEVEVTEEADDFVRFTLTEDNDLEEAYLTFEPDDWESARVTGGLDRSASFTVRTEAAAQRLLESEEVLVPDSLSSGSDGSIDSREATEAELVTCLYDHGGFTFRGTTVPAEVDLPCHAPVLGEASEVDEGSGTPISLKEGEYRLVGSIDGEETVLRSYTVEAVEEGTNGSATEDPDTETEETNESVTGDADAGTETGDDEKDGGSEEADGTGGEDVSDEDEGGLEETLPISLREIGRYIGIGAAVLLGFVAFVALLILVVRRLREIDLGREGSDGGNGQRRMVLDTDSENDVYVSWSDMVERAGVEDVRTKTPSEIAESAKEAGLNPEAVDELTDVFEEVRYGEGEPTAEQEERARKAFERIERSNGRK